MSKVASPLSCPGSHPPAACPRLTHPHHPRFPDPCHVLGRVTTATSEVASPPVMSRVSPSSHVQGRLTPATSKVDLPLSACPRSPHPCHVQGRLTPARSKVASPLSRPRSSHPCHHCPRSPHLRHVWVCTSMPHPRSTQPRHVQGHPTPSCPGSQPPVTSKADLPPSACPRSPYPCHVQGQLSPATSKVASPPSCPDLHHHATSKVDSPLPRPRLSHPLHAQGRTPVLRPRSTHPCHV